MSNINDSIKQYVRKPFAVEGLQVTEENIHQVAEWCNGSVRTGQGRFGRDKELFVRVWVLRPQTDRQTMAFVGDWVLYAGTGFKVYTNEAFEKNFEVPAEAKETTPKLEFVAAEV